MVANKGLERKELRLPRGAYSRIARRVRPVVSPQMVRAVYLGRATSARIARAIARYVEQLEKESAA